MQVTSNTNVGLVVDESGSMVPFTKQVIEQFTKQYNDIPRGNDVQILTFSEQVRSVRALTSSTYRPRGGTALWDAVDRAISDADDGSTPVLIIVLTDGEENQSVHTSASELSRRIRRLQATDRFTFAFMVPRGYKRALVNQLGIPEGNVTEWEQTDDGFNQVLGATSAATASYFTARSAGRKSVSTFYSDASQVKPADIRQLTRLSNTAVLTVPREMEIRTFIEDQGHVYVPGRAAYQLTKPELVQADKSLFIMEKGKAGVYSGDVRGLLGLPDTDIKVVPGNHANFDIFVQSKSVNRKLVRGTKLLYWKG